MQVLAGRVKISSFSTKPCAIASSTYLAGIISIAVDYTDVSEEYANLHHEVR
jgi:hypothetical protein